MANTVRASVYLSTNTSEECRKGAAIPSRFPWSLWLQEGETLTASGLCLLTSHFSLVRLGKQLYISRRLRNVAIYKAVIHFHIDPFSQSNKFQFNLHHGAWWNMSKQTIWTYQRRFRVSQLYMTPAAQTSGQVCECEGSSKNLPNEKDQLNPELYTVSPPFL